MFLRFIEILTLYIVFNLLFYYFHLLIIIAVDFILFLFIIFLNSFKNLFIFLNIVNIRIESLSPFIRLYRFKPFFQISWKNILPWILLQFLTQLWYIYISIRVQTLNLFFWLFWTSLLPRSRFFFYFFWLVLKLLKWIIFSL